MQKSGQGVGGEMAKRGRRESAQSVLWKKNVSYSLFKAGNESL